MTPKEKILRNLDKICLDPVGYLANAELLNELLKKQYAMTSYKRHGEFTSLK